MSPERGVDLIREAQAAFPREVWYKVQVWRKRRLCPKNLLRVPTPRAGRSVVILRN